MILQDLQVSHYVMWKACNDLTGILVVGMATMKEKVQSFETKQEVYVKIGKYMKIWIDQQDQISFDAIKVFYYSFINYKKVSKISSISSFSKTILTHTKFFYRRISHLDSLFYHSCAKVKKLIIRCLKNNFKRMFLMFL